MQNCLANKFKPYPHQCGLLTFFILQSASVLVVYLCIVYKTLALIIYICVYSNSRNDVLRVAQRYGTIAVHTRRRASVLVVIVVFACTFTVLPV